MICPYCEAEYDPKQGRFCQSCGIMISPPGSEDEKPPEEDAGLPPKRQCHFCGTKAAAVYCPSCGHRLPVPEDEEEAEEESEAKTVPPREGAVYGELSEEDMAAAAIRALEEPAAVSPSGVDDTEQPVEAKACPACGTITFATDSICPKCHQPIPSVDIDFGDLE